MNLTLMKKRLSVLVLFSWVCFVGFSQQKELEAFKQTIIQYNEYAEGKAQEAEHKKKSAEEYRSNIDKSFRDFVLLKNSENYDQLKTFEGGMKELTLDNKVTVNIQSFNLKNVIYVVYAFDSFLASDYYVKDIAKNKIVYHNKKNVPYMDAIYIIDNKHFLIIEKYGDLNTSRRAFVVKADKKLWTAIPAFEGNELIYREEKEFKKERPYLLVWCDFETQMNAPRNASTISFDTATQTISYKTFENERIPQIVRAQWKDSHFIIDDYDVGNHILGFSPVGAP